MKAENISVMTSEVLVVCWWCSRFCNTIHKMAQIEKWWLNMLNEKEAYRPCGGGPPMLGGKPIPKNTRYISCYILNIYWKILQLLHSKWLEHVLTCLKLRWHQNKISTCTTFMLRSAHPIPSLPLQTNLPHLLFTYFGTFHFPHNKHPYIVVRI